MGMLERALDIHTENKIEENIVTNEMDKRKNEDSKKDISSNTCKFEKGILSILVLLDELENKEFISCIASNANYKEKTIILAKKLLGEFI